METADTLRYDDRGLIPAVLQDAETGQVLMVAWMNAEHCGSLRAEAHFWSRSRQTLWHKGATSGNMSSAYARSGWTATPMSCS